MPKRVIQEYWTCHQHNLIPQLNAFMHEGAEFDPRTSMVAAAPVRRRAPMLPNASARLMDAEERTPLLRLPTGPRLPASDMDAVAGVPVPEVTAMDPPSEGIIDHIDDTDNAIIEVVDDNVQGEDTQCLAAAAPSSASGSSGGGTGSIAADTTSASIAGRLVSAVSATDLSQLMFLFLLHIQSTLKPLCARIERRAQGPRSAYIHTEGTCSSTSYVSVRSLT